MGCPQHPCPQPPVCVVGEWGGGYSDPQSDLLKLQTEYFWQLPRRQSSPSLILLAEMRRGLRKRRRREEGEQERESKTKKKEGEGPQWTEGGWGRRGGTG